MTNARAFTIAWVAASAACIAAIWVVAAEARHGIAPRPPPPVDDARDEVTGFSGEIALEKGARLSVRIARLHSERDRQRFDAAALKRRFALSEGEPFACELRYFEGEPAANSVARTIDVSGVSLVDAKGSALAPLAAPELGAPDRVVDPLATLLAPPATALAPGQSICLVLWGREPGAEPRLVLGSMPEIALASASLRRLDIDSSLARIEVARPVARGAEDR